MVTKPFDFEGKKRKMQAEEGLRLLRANVDTLITIPNQRLLQVVERGTSLRDAFRVADNVLRQAVQGISDLITTPGLINLDFADVQTIMTGMGMAVMGTGVAHGDNRAIEAAHQAISSPLLEESSIDGARGVLLNVTGGPDMALHEIHEAAAIIRESAHEEAHIIFGAVIDEKLENELRVTVIATGFHRPEVETRSTAWAALARARARDARDARDFDEPYERRQRAAPDPKESLPPGAEANERRSGHPHVRAAHAAIARGTMDVLGSMPPRADGRLLWRETATVTYLEPLVLSAHPRLRCAFTTRHAGRSGQSLNLSFDKGERTAVLAHRQHVLQALDLEQTTLCTVRQVHGNQVCIVDAASCRRSDRHRG